MFLPKQSNNIIIKKIVKEQWRRYYDDLNVALDMRKVDKTYPYPVKPEEG